MQPSYLTVLESISLHKTTNLPSFTYPQSFPIWEAIFMTWLLPWDHEIQYKLKTSRLNFQMSSWPYKCMTL